PSCKSHGPRNGVIMKLLSFALRALLFCLAAFALAAGAARAANSYQVRNIVSDGAVPADHGYDFVAGNKIVVMFPPSLCGRRQVTPSANCRRIANARQHNRLQGIQPIEERFVVLPDCV